MRRNLISRGGNSYTGNCRINEYEVIPGDRIRKTRFRKIFLLFFFHFIINYLVSNELSPFTRVVEDFSILDLNFSSNIYFDTLNNPPLKLFNL